MNATSSIRFAFFGTGILAESVLAALARAGLSPTLLVTKPDAPQGRHMLMTEPHIKTWCKMKGIDVFQPETLKDLPLDSPLHMQEFDVFIVASYGKFIPNDLLTLSKYGVLNVHPSLLPLYRGPSPIESALLDGASTIGVTIMKIDNEMDHGPILAQNAFPVEPQMITKTLEVVCGQLGGDMLVQVLDPYLAGALKPREQDHDKATICKKITKELGEITLATRADEVQKKFRALTPWPSLYFFMDYKGKKMRVKVTDVDLLITESQTLVAGDVILKVIPEGKKEMKWSDFRRGYLSK